MGTFDEPFIPAALRGFRDRALAGFRRLGRGEEAALELEDVERVVTAEQEGFRILLQPGVRVAVFMGVGLAVFQQITGIKSVLAANGGVSNRSAPKHVYPGPLTPLRNPPR